MGLGFCHLASLRFREQRVSDGWFAKAPTEQSRQRGETPLGCLTHLFIHGLRSPQATRALTGCWKIVQERGSPPEAPPEPGRAAVGKDEHGHQGSPSPEGAERLGGPSAWRLCLHRSHMTFRNKRSSKSCSWGLGKAPQATFSSGSLPCSAVWVSDRIARCLGWSHVPAESHCDTLPSGRIWR